MHESFAAAFISDFFTAPSGPGTPFATPELAVVDTIRCFVLGVGIIVFFASIHAMFLTKTIGQIARLATLVVFLSSSMLTEFDHFGDYAHYRLYLHMIATIIAAWGTFSFFRFEKPATVRPASELDMHRHRKEPT